MLLTLDTASAVPLYVQLRNQIVTGIGRGELKAGESLPTVRRLAQDTGLNAMTVNKTYQILKAEGFIAIDRRRGATVRPVRADAARCREKLAPELELLCAEACLRGMTRQEFLAMCERAFAGMAPVAAGEV